MNDLASQLRERGFDVKKWDLGIKSGGIIALQITDYRGITFYACEGRTLEQCLEIHEQKLMAFRLADNKK